MNIVQQCCLVLCFIGWLRLLSDASFEWNSPDILLIDESVATFWCIVALLPSLAFAVGVVWNNIKYSKDYWAIQTILSVMCIPLSLRAIAQDKSALFSLELATVKLLALIHIALFCVLIAIKI